MKPPFVTLGLASMGTCGDDGGPTGDDELGMATVLGIVRQSGGTVRLRSPALDLRQPA